jgi:hypothetical protein
MAMERWYRHYGIATYGLAPNSRWRSGHRPATQGLPKPVRGLSLEVVNGHRRRRSGDGLSKSPWGARNAREYHPPDLEANDRSSLVGRLESFKSQSARSCRAVGYNRWRKAGIQVMTY